MGGSLFGRQLQLMTFGESHGPAVGGVIDGIPAGIPVDFEFLHAELGRRKPTDSTFETTRREDDRIEILSGVLDGITLGTPVGFMIRNKKYNPGDYHALRHVYRPGHGDFTWQQKYGFRDFRGGGRSSARETVARVAAGAFAKMILREKGILVYGFVNAIGTVELPGNNYDYKVSDIEKSVVRCPDPVISRQMEQAIDEVIKENDSIGGVVTCVIKNCPAGIGEPVFDKLESMLSHAVMSIPAFKAVEIGEGFKAARSKGSRHNDTYSYDDGKIKPRTNHAGGILGGISSGEDILLRGAVKPVSSIAKMQHTVDDNGNPVELSVKGRHDVCVVPRAVPVAEAMVALALADLLLIQESMVAFRR